MSTSNWRGKYRPSSSTQQEEAMNEMEYEGAFEEASTSILADLTQNERAVHLDFFNNFDDIFNDQNLD
ncbi:hypothetical protein EMCRGX_G026231 [Ephydatia muelleri]